MIPIETYKGFKIEYDIDKETFTCNIVGQCRYSQSLKDVRKKVDKFLTQNKAFKPIKCYFNPYGVLKEILITSIRVDDGLQATVPNNLGKGVSQKIPHHHFNDLFILNDKNKQGFDNILDLKAKIQLLKKQRTTILESLDNFDVIELKKQYRNT